jgi:N-acetylglucosaminyldiphosphoundecaprenol N-acetyl-beta-D-mannosaminyltransferase
LAIHNTFTFPDPERLPFHDQALREFLNTRMPVDKKRIHLGLIEVDTYLPEELTSRLVFNSLTSSTTRHVVTANAQFYVMAERIHRFRKCLERAEYVCADGFSIQLACKWLANTMVARCPGVDLVHDLCREGAGYGLRIYLLGGLPGAADASARILEKSYPGLKVAGTDCPPLSFERNSETLQEVLTRISDAQPQVVLVGLGAPKQEYFIDEHLRPLGIPVAIGVGGTFEMISGRVPRAPEWIRRIGMEWGYRLFREPKRLWRRYLIGNLEFLFIVTFRYLLGADPEQALPVAALCDQFPEP